MLKIVSFDVDGTLTTPRFTDLIWEEAIPRLYAKKTGIDLDRAKSYVMGEYEKVGEERLEWYDIKYWFERFGLADSGYEKLLEKYKGEVFHYPEVQEVLENLGKKYQLIVTTNSTREFLKFKLRGIKNYFTQVFSAPSDFSQIKKSANFYLSVCAILKVEPGEIAHTGDHWLFDFITPRKVGIEAFYLDRSREKMGKFVVRDLKEFEKKLMTPIK